MQKFLALAALSAVLAGPAAAGQYSGNNLTIKIGYIAQRIQQPLIISHGINHYSLRNNLTDNFLFGI